MHSLEIWRLWIGAYWRRLYARLRPSRNPSVGIIAIDPDAAFGENAPYRLLQSIRYIDDMGKTVFDRTFTMPDEYEQYMAWLHYLESGEGNPDELQS